MNHLEIDFAILRNESNEIIGISFVAQPQTEAEYFCARFPSGLKTKKSDIEFRKGQMVLTDETEGKYTVELNESDFKEIYDLLNGDKKLKLEKAGFLTPGFKIILANETQ